MSAQQNSSNLNDTPPWLMAGRSSPANRGGRLKPHLAAIVVVNIVLAGCVAQDARPTENTSPTVSAASSFVGQRIGQLAQELTTLEASLSHRDTQLHDTQTRMAGGDKDYQGATTEIRARLQSGETRGNPELVARWSRASNDVELIGKDLQVLQSMANDVAADQSRTGYTLHEIEGAYLIQGAVKADHQQLDALKARAARLSYALDEQQTVVLTEVARRQVTLANSRSDLTALLTGIQNGELVGGESLAAQIARGEAAAAASAPARDANKPPLVQIRFDEADPQYEAALYEAVRRAIEVNPRVTFDLVAVSTPAAAAAAQRALARVERSLLQLGLPGDRISQATASDQIDAPEIRIYVR